MAIVYSLLNKIDELATLENYQIFRECSLLMFMETWLTDVIPDANKYLLSFTTVRADRDTKVSGKSKGGGLIMYTKTAGVTPAMFLYRWQFVKPLAYSHTIVVEIRGVERMHRAKCLLYTHKGGNR